MPELVHTINSKEWNKLYSNALSSSISTTWELADVVSMGVEKWGKQNVLDMTALDNSKVRWLCSISKIVYRDYKLLPEHHAEVASLAHPKVWLKKAIQQNLKPTELRALIRKHNTKYPNNEKKIKRTELMKAILVLESQYKRSNDENNKNIIRERLRKLI